MIKIEHEYPVKGYVYKKITVAYGPCNEKDTVGIEFKSINTDVKDRDNHIKKFKITNGDIKLPTGILGKYKNIDYIAKLLAAPVVAGEGRLGKVIPLKKSKKGFKLNLKKSLGRSENEDDLGSL